jgi:transcriptional regulator GlxA family with amidase domain
MAEDLPVVRGGALWTCGGAATGIEMAFQMAQSLVGEGPVARLRMRLQVDGHPTGAPGEPSPHGSVFEAESRTEQDRRWQVVRRAAQRLGCSASGSCSRDPMAPSIRSCSSSSSVARPAI